VSLAWSEHLGHGRMGGWLLLDEIMPGAVPCEVLRFRSLARCVRLAANSRQYLRISALELLFAVEEACRTELC